MSGDAPLHPFILVRNLDFELGELEAGKNASVWRSLSVELWRHQITRNVPEYGACRSCLILSWEDAERSEFPGGREPGAGTADNV